MTFIESLNELSASGEPFVSVTVVETTGSVPCETGAKMLVTRAGRHSGTVGGGELEQHAVARAFEILTSGERAKATLVPWNLNRDLEMTCAGTVSLFFEPYHLSRWNIVIFGAGHVACALVKILVELDCRVTCIDPREEWIAKLPASDRLQRVRIDHMPSKVAEIPDDAFVLVMTMGHETDRDVVAEILRTREFPYLGVIGSASKAGRLRAQLVELGIAKERAAAFLCPIGLPLGSNQPAEIAISVAAQLIQERDRVRRVEE